MKNNYQSDMICLFVQLIYTMSCRYQLNTHKARLPKSVWALMIMTVWTNIWSIDTRHYDVGQFEQTKKSLSKHGGDIGMIVMLTSFVPP